MDKVEKVALIPRRELLDPEFEGYKLSLDALAIYECKLDGRTLSPRQLADSQYSFLHSKLFSASNLLVRDPRDDRSAYLLDPEDDAVLRIVDRSDEASGPEIYQVWSSSTDVPVPRPGDYNPSLSFPGADLATFADGRGTLYILKTGPRWTKASRVDDVCGSGGRPFVIASSSLTDGDTALNVMVQHVEEASKCSSRNVVEWLTFDVSSWELCRVRRFAFPGDLNFLDFVGDGFCCLTDKPFNLTFDSSSGDGDGAGTEKNEEEKAEEEKEAAEKKPPFFWFQGVEDVVVWVDVPENVGKRDVKVTLKPSEIQVVVGGETLIGGKLWDVIDGDSTTWTIQKRRLEITACKAKRGLVWQRLLRPEDPSSTEDGMEVSDPKEVDVTIAHFNELAVVEEMESSEGKLFNSQELEACDAPPDGYFSFYYTDGAAKLTHKAGASGRQWICNVPTASGATAVCLRHDVDGLVWQPRREGSSSFNLQHLGTFAALGYVQASKQQRKFTCASPNMSFVAICDISRHVYIYRQPSKISSGSELRNRKSGKRVEKIAKQEVISLQESNDGIVGAIATENSLFVATKTAAFILRVNADQC